MKKLTVYLEGSETVVDLQNAVLSTENEYVFVKKAAVFWEYNNIGITFIMMRDVGGTNIKRLGKGYYTFDDLKDSLSTHVDLVARKYDGKCEITNSGKSELLLAKYACDLLGFYCDDITGKYKRIHPGSVVVSDTKVDINRGLRYINISCNLVNSESNYTNGRKSSTLVSLPITTTQSLFGSVSNYIDIESKVPVVKGSFSQIKFNITDQDLNPVDVGNILVELYIV